VKLASRAARIDNSYPGAEVEMKILIFTVMLAALTAGMASAQRYSACANNNSQACRDARNAFAEHHSGQYPNQYYNQWYSGQPGRWNQQNNNWRWEGRDGDEYWRGDRGWEWKHHEHHHHDHDDD
jgi:hypothetical protein